MTFQMQKIYRDQDGIVRHTDKDSQIIGKDGCVIQVGDTVQYMNNPNCKPLEVVDFTKGWIYTTGGCGDSCHYALISKRKNTDNIVRNPL